MLERLAAKSVTDPKVVAELFHPREDLSEEAKQKLIEMVAESGAILRGHFELEED